MSEPTRRPEGSKAGGPEASKARSSEGEAPTSECDPISVSAATLISPAPATRERSEPVAEPSPQTSQSLEDTQDGPLCPSCAKLNHPGTSQCVFCGNIFLSSPDGAGPGASPKAFEPDRGSAPSSSSIDVSIGPVLASSHASSAALRRSKWTTDLEEIQAPVADPLIGVVVADRYRILEGLGRGGMGIVYKVEHKQIGKLLAMKLLTGELSRNPEVVRRFKHEALTASRLSSPNTVQVFDFGASEGLTYLVMELVAGEDLGRILRTHGPVSWGRLGKVVVQACSSLAEAHGKGIVHRDIKPENIMLVRARDGGDIAKVLDFGLAKLREGEGLSELTSAGAIVGTPYFMSPEQVRGDPVDPRSDIYSLGALMYRALTGHYPFSGPTPMSVFTKHLNEMAIPPIERAPELGIPPGVSRLVMKALKKSPAERFQRVEDLQAAAIEQLKALGTGSVEKLLDSGAVRKLETAQPPAETGIELATRDEVERYERKLRRQRYTAAAMLTLLFLGAVGGAAQYLSSRKPVFNGLESEANDTAADADPVPFGRTVSAYLGRRIEVGRGDRDFFEIDIPASEENNMALVRLEVTSLPNIPLCAFLYRPGLSTALGQYCVGRAGRDLVIPAFRIEAGRYFVAVLQDMDPYGPQPPPFVFENVSDLYSVTLGPGESVPNVEIEPNDQVASANYVGVGESMTGALAWARDEDVFCVRADAGARVRLRVTDISRDIGAVLEAVPMRGTEEGAAVRIHLSPKNNRLSAPSAPPGGSPVLASLGESDIVGPWESEEMVVETDPPRCVRVRLALDPWEPNRAFNVPIGGSEPYQIDVLAVE